MTDRELLEAAAKAAGIEPAGEYGSGALYVITGPQPHDAYAWNPLESDGDALRLALILRMSIDFRDDGTVNAEIYHLTRMNTLAFEPLGDDPAAATRRAIVRCAAIGGAQ
jgi:hypothetical protein